MTQLDGERCSPLSWTSVQQSLGTLLYLFATLDEAILEFYFWFISRGTPPNKNNKAIILTVVR